MSASVIVSDSKAVAIDLSPYGGGAVLLLNTSAVDVYVDSGPHVLDSVDVGVVPPSTCTKLAANGGNILWPSARRKLYTRAVSPTTIQVLPG